jgi:hypothetical protein
MTTHTHRAKHPSRRRRNGKENRQWSDTLNTWAVPINSAIVIVVFVISLVAYAITNNSCDALCSEIARQEARQRDLMDELQRETNKWNNMKTPANLERRLLNHGIAMWSPRPTQRIAMSGRPSPGSAQESTAYAANR